MKGATAQIRVLVQAAQARRAAKLLERDLLRVRSAANFSNIKGLTRVGRNFRDLTKQAGALGQVMSRSGSAGVGMFKRMSVASRLAVGALGTLGNAITGLGRDMQWLGRQIEFRISLPLAVAAGFAIKFALDNETAFTRIRKVYGGAADDIGKFDADLGRLRIAFENLSDVFGVHQKDVLEVASTWAQAGAQGRFLADAVKLSIQTAILGEIELADATKGLLVIQQAYQLNIEELVSAVAVLNQVENETTATLPDLIEVFQDAAGAAQVTGTSIEQLAAVTAALIPVAGSASEVGNALKTIMARVAAPTNQAAAAFKAIGVDIGSVEFASAGLTDKLFLLSRGFNDLSTAQQTNFIREVFQLRQFSRSSILLTDLLNKYSRYAKAIDVTSSAQANSNKFNQELLTFLESSPQKIKILTVRIQNMLADLGIQILPVFTAIVSGIEGAFRSFNSLGEKTKRNVMAVAAAIGVIGPLLGILGAVVILVGVIFRPLAFLLKIMITLPSAIINLAKHILLLTKFMVDLVLWLPRVVLGMVRFAVSMAVQASLGAARLTLSLVKLVTILGTLAWAALGPAIRAVWGLAASFVKLAISSIPMVLTGLGQLALVLLDIAVLALGAAITALRPLVLALARVAMAAFVAAKAITGALLTSLWGLAKTAATAAVAIIGPLLTGLWGLVTAAVAAATAIIGPLLTGLWGLVTAAVAAATAIIGPLLTGLGRLILGAITAASALTARLASALAIVTARLALMAASLSTMTFAIAIRNVMLFAGTLMFLATRAIMSVVIGLGMLVLGVAATAQAFTARLAAAAAVVSTQFLLMSVRLSTLTFAIVIRNAMLFAGTLMFLATRAIASVVTSLGMLILRASAVAAALTARLAAAVAVVSGQFLLLSIRISAISFATIMRNVMLFAGTMIFLATRAIASVVTSLGMLILRITSLTFAGVIRNAMLFGGTMIFLATRAIVSVITSLGALMVRLGVLTFFGAIKEMVIFGRLAITAVVQGTIMMVKHLAALAVMMTTRVIQAFISAGMTMVAFALIVAQNALIAIPSFIASMVTMARTMITRVVLAVTTAVVSMVTLGATMMWTGTVAAARMIASMVTLGIVMLANVVPSLAVLVLNLSMVAVVLVRVGKQALVAAARMVVAWGAAILPILLKVALVVAAIGLLNMAFKAVFGKSIPDLMRAWFNFLGDLFSRVGEAFSHLGEGMSNLWAMIQRGMAKLPQVFTDVMQKIIDVLGRAIPAIWDMLSYLNPFATHSPSLVSQVKDGVDAIIGHYDRATVIVGLFKRAAKNLEAFNEASRAARASMRDKDIASQRAVVATVAPEAVGAFDLVAKDIHDMNAELELLQSAINDQQQVVNDWANSLIAAEAALTEANDALQVMVDSATEIQDAIQAAQSHIDDLASTPITGMNAAVDTIDATTFAMKELQLQILLLEQAQGPIEDTQAALARLGGELELLRGNRNDLRLAGAGSDILNVVDSRIAELEAAQAALQNGTSDGVSQQIADLEAQLADLQLQNQIAELQFAIDFGPMVDEINSMVTTVNEMDFQDIVDQILAEQENIDNLTGDLDAINGQIQTQAEAVKALQDARDAAQATYDEELAKLNGMKEGYKALAEMLRDAEAALRDFNTAASTGGTNGGTDFGPGVDIPNVTGSGAAFGAAGFDQAALDAFIADNIGMDTINPFDTDALKEKFDKFKARLKVKFADLIRVWEKFRAKATIVFNRVLDWWRDHKEEFAGYLRQVGVWFTNLGENIKRIWTIAWPYLRSAFSAIIDGAAWIVKSLEPIFNELGKWGPVMHDIKMIILGVVGAIVWLIKQISADGTILHDVFVGTWTALVDVIVGALEFIRGFWMFWSSLFKGDWGGVWDAIKLMFTGIWHALGGIVRGAFAVLDGLWEVFKMAFMSSWNEAWGLVKSTFDAIWKSLKGIVGVALDAIKLAISTTKSAILLVWNGIWDAVKLAFTTVWDVFSGAVTIALDAVKLAITTAKTGLQTAWDGITGVFRTAADGIKAILDPIITVIGKIVDFVKNPPDIKGAVGDAISSIPGAGVVADVGGALHIPGFARGGLTSGPALVGEGRPKYPEFVIPTDPMYARRAQGLLSLANQAIAPRGIQRPSAGRGLINAGGSKQTTNNFNGDLVFPNITDGKDAREFIENLTSLIDDTTT